MHMTPPVALSPPLQAVTVRAPGRLHLGFLDPSATLGRRYGSLGLVVDGFETVVELRRAATAASAGFAATDAAGAAERDRALAHLGTLQRACGRPEPLQLALHGVLPAHAGFGSGTQLALAVGRGFAALHGLALSTTEIAGLLGRGLRSGVGIAGFDQGGLLLDGGPSNTGRPAPLIARHELPQAWRVLLMLDLGQRGLSGDDEKAAIATLPAFAQADAAAVCHEVLMRVLPGAASGDFAAFAAGLTRVQELVGRHFAPAQGGSVYASPRVEALCRHVAAQGPAAIGQSSWGPTGFAVLPSQAEAERRLASARAAGLAAAPLQAVIVSARNSGASVCSPTLA